MSARCSNNQPAMTCLKASLSREKLVAQVNVLISGGFSGAYEELLPEFERASGIEVATGSGASQGTGPQTIAAQLARGVPSDVVILSREEIGRAHV